MEGSPIDCAARRPTGSPGCANDRIAFACRISRKNSGLKLDEEEEEEEEEEESSVVFVNFSTYSSICAVSVSRKTPKFLSGRKRASSGGGAWRILDRKAARTWASRPCHDSTSAAFDVVVAASGSDFFLRWRLS